MDGKTDGHTERQTAGRVGARCAMVGLAEGKQGGSFDETSALSGVPARALPYLQVSRDVNHLAGLGDPRVAEDDAARRQVDARSECAGRAQHRHRARLVRSLDKLALGMGERGVVEGVAQRQQARQGLVSAAA
eukprot:355543-Chlamydomonas_euryale.AAC.2